MKDLERLGRRRDQSHRFASLTGPYRSRRCENGLSQHFRAPLNASGCSEKLILHSDQLHTPADG